VSWAGKKVLVTGAGGFIGSHLTERLIEAGAQCHAYVRYNSAGTWGWLDRIPSKDSVQVFVGDICDPDCLGRAMQDVEIVFHLAALIGIPYSYAAPSSYVRTNIEGTLNVLQTARRLGVGCIVHTSTSEVYGTARYVPIDEKHPLQGQSPYAASKIGADKLAESFYLSYELPVVTVRPFNTFGPRQSLRAVIPTIISQCLEGGTVRLGSLHPTRDMSYVGNTVDGFLRAALCPGAVGRTINLGSGVDISIEALARFIARLVDRDVIITSEPKRVRPEGSEVQRLLAECTTAKTLLAWEPSVPLEEGLRITIEWVRRHLNEYRVGIYAF